MRAIGRCLLAGCLAACAPPADVSEGALAVRAHEAGTVYVDARPAAEGELRLTRGQHVVELRRGTVVIASASVEVRAGQRVELDLDGTHAGAITADAAMSGRVEVRAVPPDATIEIDGVEAGLGSVVIDLVPGPHVIRVTAPGLEPHEQEIFVGVGALIEIDVTLRALRNP